MGRLIIAFKLFFAALFNREKSVQLARALTPGSLDVAPVAPVPTAVAKPPEPRPEPRRGNTDAVVLLATLQREARLVDFLKEDLSAYSDDQVGAAVRAIHQDAAKVIDRLFGLKPILAESEGDPITVPAGFDAARYRLTGHLAGQPPFKGTLRHHGWEATRCDVPQFTGTEAAARLIAPAEVEVA